MDLVTLLIEGFSSLVIAAFTILAWKLQKQSYDSANFANLRVCASKAEVKSGVILCDVLLINTSEAPAVVTDWTISLQTSKISSFKAGILLQSW